jgi:hypothetical protein
MLGSYARTAMLGLALWALTGLALADDVSDFNAAVEAAEAHNRVAIGYLRTGNADLASLEIDRLREAWGKVGTVKRPALFDGALYVGMLTDASMRLVTADMLLNSGRPDNARQSLEGIRTDLYNLRKSAGIVVLSDCILDSNKAAAAVIGYDTPDLDMSKPGVGPAIAEKAKAYTDVLNRCDGVASETVRKEPEFRRLIDDAKSELAKVSQAIANRDTGQFRRIVSSLRSLDNLLAFRFG